MYLAPARRKDATLLKVIVRLRNVNGRIGVVDEIADFASYGLREDDVVVLIVDRTLA
jgi:hypothetical protein